MINYPFNVSDLMLRIGNLIRGSDEEEFASPVPNPGNLANDTAMAAEYSEMPRRDMPAPMAPPPVPQQMAAPPMDPSMYPDIIREGFAKWGGGTPPPISEVSPQLAELGQQLPHPYLPAALTLKETGGLTTAGQEINNPVGIGPGIAYPDLPTAIMGGGDQGLDGGPQQGLKGVLLNSGIYDDYLKSGNLKDFFSHYTPEGSHNNPTYDSQIELINSLMSIFEDVEKSKRK